MFRFFPSIVFLQIILSVVVYFATYVSNTLAYTSVAIFIFVSSLLFSIWLKTLSQLHGKDELFRHKERFAKEREDLRVKAEKDKLRVVKDSQKQAQKDVSRSTAKANFKVGVAVAGAIGLGALLVVSQMLTLGLLTLTTAGGGLAGYLVRARQDKKLLSMNGTGFKGKTLSKPKAIKSIEHNKDA